MGGYTIIKRNFVFAVR